MQIHVVRPGQTIDSIAREYSIGPDRIIKANEIADPGTLVVGQALVIPIVGQYYVIQPGDSLYKIARQFGIQMNRLAEVNGISIYTPLQVGTRLYIPPGPKRSSDVYAYADTHSGRVSRLVETETEKAAPQLTYLGPSGYMIQRDGSLKAPGLDDFFDIAKDNRVTMSMVIVNMEKDQFSSELAHVILHDEKLQDRLLDNILSTAAKMKFKDVHFDIERVLPEDKEAYNQFLRKASRRIHDAGLLMSTALAPKTSATQKGEWYTAHDYKVHGEEADFVIIMTYEWGYSGGPPMPVSPIEPVRRVLEYAITEIPREKIMMGQNLYGYDWTLPYVKGTKAQGISPQGAIALAKKYKVPIQYDQKAQAPFINYTDEEGRAHKVWFEDARSIQAKFNLIKELGIRGVSYWRLGFPFPQNWLLIRNTFNVTKLV
ncbi:MAG: LysM peptidoglycan-binding domain-containing protein [Clostridia bacterium]